MGPDPFLCAMGGKTPVAVVPVLVGIGPLLVTIISAVAVALGGALVSLFKPQTIKKLFLLLWAQKIPVLVVAAAVTGAVYAWPYVFPPEIVEGAAEGEWAAFRGGPERRGTVSAGKDPAQGGILWYHTESKTYYSSPTVVGSRLYAISARYEMFKDEGTIYCIDAGTGKELWRHREPGFRATFSSPAIAGGGRYLVCGEGLHYTESARVFCFDISGKPAKVWEYSTTSHVESSPCVADGRVYIGAGDDGYYCFALEPREKGKPEIIWHLPGPKSRDREGAERIYLDCESCPIVSDRRVYFGLGIGGKAVVCADAATGKELWRVETPYPVFSSPTVSGGMLFFGMGNGDFVNRAEVVRANKIKEMRDKRMSEEEIEKVAATLGPAGEVWCVDLNAGKDEERVKWKFDVGRTVLGSIAAREGNIYFGSRNGFFYSVSAEGKLLAKFPARKAIVTSPAVGAENVYFMTEEGRVYGLEAGTLAPVWEVSLGQGKLFMSSPALGNGHLYIGSDGSGIVCAGEPSDVERETLWAGHRGGPGSPGYGGGGMLPLRGALAWRFPSEEGAAVPSISAPAAFLEGAVYVGLNAEGRCGLAKIVYDTGKKPEGEEARLVPVEKWFYAAKNAVVTSAAASSKGEVYFVDGKKGDDGRHLHCLDAAAGTLVWKRPVAEDAYGAFLVTENAVFLADGAGSLVCLDRKPKAEPSERWRAGIGGCSAAPFVCGDIVIAAASSPPGLAAVDLQTGRLLWSSELPSAPQTEAAVVRLEEEVSVRPREGEDPPGGRDEEEPKTKIVTEDLVLVGLADGLSAYNLIDGKRFWTVSCGSVKHLVPCGDRLAACVTGSSELVVVDLAGGKELQRVGDVAAAVAPMLAGDALVFCDKSSLQRWDLSSITKKPRQWMKTAWLGEVTTPIVGADSHVYFATDKKGLICARASGR